MSKEELSQQLKNELYELEHAMDSSESANSLIHFIRSKAVDPLLYPENHWKTTIGQKRWYERFCSSK
jgi:hypothetical protein